MRANCMRWPRRRLRCHQSRRWRSSGRGSGHAGDFQPEERCRSHVSGCVAEIGQNIEAAFQCLCWLIVNCTSRTGTPPDANALVPAVVLHSLPAVCRPGNCSNTGEQSGGSGSLPASSELVVTTLPTLSRFEVGWRRWRKSPVATIIWPDIPFGYLT